MRQWGWYEVLNVGLENGEEFCEKKINVSPRQALSLQRHQGRREIWSILEGELSVIINGEFKTLSAGDEIMIPNKAAHCMINLTNKPVTIHEKQIGFCREEDNDRLYDFNGRDTVEINRTDRDALRSIDVYKTVTQNLKSDKAVWYKDDASNQN